MSSAAEARAPVTPRAAAQDEIVRFLLRSESYPLPAPVEMIETHSSLVFLVGERVYKMKKAMGTSFIDYRSLDARRRNTEREAELDRAVAPDVYLGAEAVVRRADGTLAIGGKGAPVEWLVVMRRLDISRLLSSCLPDRVGERETSTRLPGCSPISTPARRRSPWRAMR